MPGRKKKKRERERDRERERARDTTPREGGTTAKPKVARSPGRIPVSPWDEQSRLAARLRELGVTCRACLEGFFSTKGIVCYKSRLAARTVTATTSTCMGGGKYPLADYTRFETEGGVSL